MVFIEYSNQGIALLVDFGRAMQYPFKFHIMEPNVFLGCLERGTVGVLSSFGHEQYPS
jgi:hypothetical protein